jgi:lipopolysaccharide export system protein LptA
MKLLFAGIALAAATLGASPACAQINKQGGPIEVTASGSLEARTDEGRSIYTKDVVVTQGDARLKTDKLTVICAKAAPDPKASRGANPSCGEVTSLIAEGAVYYLTPDGKIRGDRAVYDYAAKIITVTGDVILSREDGSVVNGTQLIYNVDAGRATMTGSNGKGVTSYFNSTPKKDAAPVAGAMASPAPAPAGTAPGAPR